jgi:SAM-dependent methyltransferase
VSEARDVRTPVETAAARGREIPTEPADAAAAPNDVATAAAFAGSWLHCFAASPYTREQFLDWIAPLSPADLAGRTICELGCGSGGLLRHAAELAAGGSVTGVELGDSIAAAERHLAEAGVTNARCVRDDLVGFAARHPEAFDVVYCIGVLHHMERPREGFAAVVRATAPGGAFHCWVYGHEGNGIVRWVVDPLRRVASHLPWWLNKYGVALPLALPFFAASRTVRVLGRRWATRLPLGEYLWWIGEREFAFHHHVAFDQLVTPRTRYFRRSEVEAWLAEHRDEVVDPYVLSRNGNSWKVGGRKRPRAESSTR